MDFFIITERRYRAQKTFDGAANELMRLQALHPEKRFQIIRCKTTINPSTLYEDLLAFVRKIATREPVAADLRREAGHLVARHDVREAKPDVEAA